MTNATPAPCASGLTRTGVLVLAAFICAAPALRAQRQIPREAENLQFGAAIRVSGEQVPGRVVTGMFAGISGDTILVGIPEGTEPVRVARADIARLELKLGRRSASGKTALWGMLVGEVVGAGIALSKASHGLPSYAAGFFLGGPAVGLMVGGALGLVSIHEDRWVDAPLELLDEAIHGR